MVQDEQRYQITIFPEGWLDCHLNTFNWVASSFLNSAWDITPGQVSKLNWMVSFYWIFYSEMKPSLAKWPMVPCWLTVFQPAQGQRIQPHPLPLDFLTFLGLIWCSGITGQMGSRQLKTCSERWPGAGPEGGTLIRTFKHCGFKSAKHQMWVNIGFGE